LNGLPLLSNYIEECPYLFRIQTSQQPYTEASKSDCVRSYCLGGHPKPASHGHLKTGQ